MYVNPNSTIILCKNVPLDNTYEHTIYFANASAQATYFSGKGVVTLNAQTYQRVERGKMRVQVNAETIYTCNYLMFKNTAYGDKWFYAFITGVEYVNDVTSEITFELDSLQTYWFDIVRKPCYVEREHSATDKIGENLLPEDIGEPELIVQYHYPYHFVSWKVAIQVKPSKIGSILHQDDIVNFENNQIVPVTEYKSANSQNDADAINQWAQQSARDNYEITNAYMYPTIFDDYESIYIPVITASDTHDVIRPTTYYDITTSSGTPLDTYVPKNKKLFTAPYTKLKVTTTMGDSADFLWENTLDGRINFGLYFNKVNKASCDLRPLNYFQQRNQRLNTLSIESFPEVTLSQYTGASLSNLLTMASRIGVAIATGNAISAVSVGSEALTKLVTDNGTNTVGTSDNNLDLKYDTFGYDFYVMGIRAQDAEVIDNYFSKYGYSTKKVKVPNINVREHWTYTKTRGCVIIGNAPADDIRKICSIFDNGITFWANASEVGDYGDLTNPVLSV